MSSLAQTMLRERLEERVSIHKSALVKQAVRNPIASARRIVVSRGLNRLLGTATTIDVRSPMFFGTAMRFQVPPSQDLWLCGFYMDEAELRLTRFIIERLEEGGVFIDGGANFGYYSLLASLLVGADGRVFAFEPSPSALFYLVDNTRETANIEIVDKALMDRRGEVDLFVGEGAPMVSSSVIAEHSKHSMSDRQERCVSVDATTLDDFVDERGIEPTFLKLDIEGAEISALRGAQRLLARSNLTISVEVAFDGLDAFDELYAPCFDLLGTLGYRAHAIHPDGSLDRLDVAHLDAYAAKIRSNRRYYHDIDNLIFAKVPQ